MPSNRRNIPIRGIWVRIMLSPEERKRLKERDSNEMDSQIKASNDARARRKLKAWLKDDLDDVYLILDKLPEDQLRRVFADDHVFKLLDLAERIMAIKRFAFMWGDIENPEKWKVAGRPGEGPNKLAEDQDIIRSFLLRRHIDALYDFYGHDTPINAFMELDRLDLDKEFHDKVTEKERAGLKRIREAIKTRWEVRDPENVRLLAKGSYSELAHRLIAEMKEREKEEPK
jgi:hypothetical protein